MRDFEEYLRVSYDSGEENFIRVTGTGTHLDVRLDRYDLGIPSTYAGMANFKNLLIHNRSEEPVNFFFTSFATGEEEVIFKQSQINSLDEEETQETSRYLAEVTDNPSLRDRLSILTRSFQNRRTNIKMDRMLLPEKELELSSGSSLKI